ncbi:NmrA/HSCARG family protein [Natronomonas marina]|jgi:uncharacterized protein YbjT (DUF2867 family)|uniref:NmrA/HSCARG family protein n=1 Tax=Natronomonas marina TaxID=2961939 RepID=UPI0020C9AA4E|nr:NmrA/HSCARG family protein [Natronomonas marina]
MSVERVLVVGATGKQGGATARHLLAGTGGRTFEVDALTRSPESDAATALAEAGANVVEGDLLRRSSLRAALEPVDAVFCVTVFRAGGHDVEVEQGVNVAEVAAEVGVEQFVYSSVASVETDTGLANFESKRAVEDRIRDLGLPATFLRPTYFMQNFEGLRPEIENGRLPLPIQPDVRLQLIDVADIGAFAATAFADPDRYVDTAIELAGDERTLESAARVFGSVLGHRVEPVSLPIEAARTEVDDVHADMHVWFNEHGYDVDIAALEREHPVSLTDLEGCLRRRGWGER